MPAQGHPIKGACVTIKSTVIASLSDFLSVLVEPGPVYWFRGERDSSRPLLPGAYRKGAEIESQRAQRFKLKAPLFYSKCPQPTEYARWLPLMQHYGVPTRLLDWTESPLCALFFAIEKNTGNTESVIYALDPGSWNQTFHGTPVQPIIESSENKVVREICTNAFIMNQQTNYPPLAIATSYSCTRMLVQMAQFTIHDCKESMETVKNSEYALRKFLIPPQNIQKLKLELSALRISRLKYFPDLDTLGREAADLEQM